MSSADAQIAFRPLLDLDFAQIAELFNRCFEGYVISFTMTPQSCAAHIRKDGVDHARSFVMRRDDQDVAIAYIAPRFDKARLAGMGVIKEARGQGVGKAVVTEFLRRLTAEGFREAVLEVFEQNTPAVRLYESFGFKPAQRLYGFSREPFSIDGAKALQEAKHVEYFDTIRELRETMSYGHTPEHGSSMTLPVRCWTVDGDAYACFAPPSEGNPIYLNAIVVRAGARGRGKGRELLMAIQAAHPTSSWAIPQTFPEAVAGFMEHHGFQRLELNQFEMRLTL